MRYWYLIKNIYFILFYLVGELLQIERPIYVQFHLFQLIDKPGVK